MSNDEIKQIIQEGIKEAHFTGLQSGKQETSGIVGEVMKRIDNSIGEAVEKHVNGKIRELTKKVDAHIIIVDAHIVKSDDYMESNELWKAEYNPYIKGLATMTGASKIVVMIAMGISAIIGAVLVVKNYFK